MKAIELTARLDDANTTLVDVNPEFIVSIRDLPEDARGVSYRHVRLVTGLDYYVTQTRSDIQALIVALQGPS